jgi:hypothetical protein
MSLGHNFNFSVFKDKENYLNGGFLKNFFGELLKFKKALKW